MKSTPEWVAAQLRRLADEIEAEGVSEFHLHAVWDSYHYFLTDGTISTDRVRRFSE